ncbi:tyrosine-type recombinase/integrase [Micromonospora matsumotoense]|uniref:tyrosine-type recombinase/integrase n=1 Tax=Micromonospora matsumotoense TaxID=121616 RepID=UPI0033F048DE
MTLPAAARTVLADRLAGCVGEGPEALVFTGDKGTVLRSGNFRRTVGWAAALRAAGMPAGFHFHDLRHTGNNLAAATGASTRDLMHRMGHASMRAALVYQHANSERDREIADGMDRRITKQAKRAAATARSSKGKGETSKVKPSQAPSKASKDKPAKRNATEAKPAARKAAKGTKTTRPARGPVSGALLARQWHARSKKASTKTAQARRECR